MSTQWVRNGRNTAGYAGECIQILDVLARIESAARGHHWEGEVFHNGAGQRLIGLRRKAARSRGAVYLSAGIHGDEPAGPLAALQLITENRWPAELDLYFCPCLNPRAFELNCRGNALGIDLNRDYREPRTDEIKAHTQWLDSQPRFDVCLCLHEDWESHGFYLYELNPNAQPSLAEAMVSAVGTVCPVDLSSTIEGRPAANGIIRPAADLPGRPDWPEAFYLIRHKTSLSYTLEAPSDFPLPPRVNSLVTGVSAALSCFLRLRNSGVALVQPGLA